jgi:hypothetical protein
VTPRRFDLKRFMSLARGMGIPADDAARLAMNIVIEQRREHDPNDAALHHHRARANAADNDLELTPSG